MAYGLSVQSIVVMNYWWQELEAGVHIAEDGIQLHLQSGSRELGRRAMLSSFSPAYEP